MVQYSFAVTCKYIFFLGKLDLAVNQYFVHLLWFVTNPSQISGREENGRKHYFLINSVKVWDGAGIQNSRSLDLQSDTYLQPADTLSTALHGPVSCSLYG